MIELLLLLALQAKTVQPPTISDSLASEFWRCTLEDERARHEAEKTAVQLAQANAKLFAACGNDYQPSLDQTKKLVCVAKPKPEEKKK